MKKEWIVEIISFLLIFLFITTAGSKLINHNQFVGQMGKSPLLVGFTHALAWIVPFTEIIIAALVAIPRTRTLGLFASFALMLTFTLYVITILLISTELPCSCGGIIRQMNWQQHLIFNIAVTVLTLIAIRLHLSQRAPGDQPESSINP